MAKEARDGRLLDWRRRRESMLCKRREKHREIRGLSSVKADGPVDDDVAMDGMQRLKFVHTCTQTHKNTHTHSTAHLSQQHCV